MSYQHRESLSIAEIFLKLKLKPSKSQPEREATLKIPEETDFNKFHVQEWA